MTHPDPRSTQIASHSFTASLPGRSGSPGDSLTARERAHLGGCPLRLRILSHQGRPEGLEGNRAGELLVCAARETTRTERANVFAGRAAIA